LSAGYAGLAVMQARKIVRGAMAGLTEQERYTIADHVVDKLTQHRDVGSLSYPDMEVGALGSAAKKIRLCALVAPHQQPSMPAPADLAAPVTDVPHLIRITMPMSPKLRVGADLNGVHAFWNRERLDLRAHVCGSSSRPSPS
jgi:hypothetical protein